jgi:hypothetical protein
MAIADQSTPTIQPAHTIQPTHTLQPSHTIQPTHTITKALRGLGLLGFFSQPSLSPRH